MYILNADFCRLPKLRGLHRDVSHSYTPRRTELPQKLWWPNLKWEEKWFPQDIFNCKEKQIKYPFALFTLADISLWPWRSAQCSARHQHQVLAVEGAFGKCVHFPLAFPSSAVHAVSQGGDSWLQPDPPDPICPMLPLRVSSAWSLSPERWSPFSFFASVCAFKWHRNPLYVHLTLKHGFIVF